MSNKVFIAKVRYYFEHALYIYYDITPSICWVEYELSVELSCCRWFTFSTTNNGPVFRLESVDNSKYVANFTKQ